MNKPEESIRPWYRCWKSLAVAIAIIAIIALVCMVLVMQWSAIASLLAIVLKNLIEVVAALSYQCWILIERAGAFIIQHKEAFLGGVTAICLVIWTWIVWFRPWGIEIEASLKNVGIFIARKWKASPISTTAIFLIGLIMIVCLKLPMSGESSEASVVAELYEKISTENIGTLVGVVLTLVTIWIVIIQLWLQSRNARKQISAEQFKNAINHLGSENVAVVLGGVHSLYDLAMNFKQEYSQQVFEILCSYIRTKTVESSYQEGVKAAIDFADKLQNNKLFSHVNPKATPLMIVVQTIVDKLFRDEKNTVFEKYETNLAGAFLCGINLAEAKLKNADLSRVKLMRTFMHGADLREAWLAEAELQGACLDEVKLQEAYLAGAKMQGARLVNAEMQVPLIHLKDANFSGVQSNRGTILNYRIMPVKSNSVFETNLSGIKLYGSDGKPFPLEEGVSMKEHFKNTYKVIMDEFTAKDAEEIFKVKVMS